MAQVRGTQLVVGFTAGQDLTGTAREWIAVSLNGTAEEIIRPSGSDVAIIGILQADKPASGSGASVVIHGPSKVKANGAFSIGDKLMVAATTGKVDTVTAIATPYAATSINVIGIALQAAGAAGEVVEMFVHQWRDQT